jgi:hypothetical protein
MKKLILTLISTLTILVGYSQTSNVNFSYTTYDFGTIPFTGDTIVAHFWFKNTGTEDFKIYSVKPSCGCTVASFQETTSPGTGGEIVVKYFNANPGFINKSLTVTTNNPVENTIVLRIKGETVKN